MYKKYSIKEVSEIFGITTNKIRFYEKKGLIKTRRNEENDYRYFTDEDLVKLQTILMYRELNLSIEDIKDLFEDSSKNNVLNHYHNQWKVINREIHKMKLLRESIEKIMDNIYEVQGDEYTEHIVETTREMMGIWSIKDNWKDKWNFDSWAKTYDESVEKDIGALKIYENYERILQTVYEKAKKNLSKDGKILEIGVGTGNLAEKFLMDGCDIVGIDQSREMLNVAKAKHGELKVRLGEFLKIPFENSSFDLIVSTYAFHHLNDEEKALAIMEMKRVLRDNGKVIIGDLMFESKTKEKKVKETMSSQQIEEIEDEYYSNIEMLSLEFEKYGMRVDVMQIDQLNFILEVKDRCYS